MAAASMSKDGEDFWRLKISAFLHDPPHKALLLGRKVAHEPVAKDLIKAAIGASATDEQWDLSKTADRIAAAADRTGVQPEMETFWSAQPKLIHPLSARHFDLVTLRSVDVNDLTNRVLRVIPARLNSGSARFGTFCLRIRECPNTPYGITTG